MAGADFTVHSSLVATASRSTKGMSVASRFAFLEIDGDERASVVELNKYHELVNESDLEGTGAIVLSLRGMVTEAIVADNTDAVITVAYDVAGGTTHTSIGTITGVTAQPIGDILDGSLTAFWGEHTSSADISAYCVPAGKNIEVALTTAQLDGTAGDTTGKILVIVEYVVIPRRIGEL